MPPRRCHRTGAPSTRIVLALEGECDHPRRLDAHVDDAGAPLVRRLAVRPHAVIVQGRELRRPAFEELRAAVAEDAVPVAWCVRGARRRPGPQLPRLGRRTRCREVPASVQEVPVDTTGASGCLPNSTPVAYPPVSLHTTVPMNASTRAAPSSGWVSSTANPASNALRSTASASPGAGRRCRAGRTPATRGM